MSIPGSPEDLVFVIAKHFQPRIHVGGVAVRIVRNAAFSHHEDAGEFGAEFFLCIFNVAKSLTVIECFPVEALRRTGPVRRFMERRPVIIRRGAKG